MQTSQQIVVQSTYDYDLFKFYDSNRVAEHWPKIAQSIEQHDLTPFNPIIVDKDLYIVDGQNRFMACKHLKKPIYFLISPKCTDKDIPLLNAGQKNWTLQNYLNFYVKHGFPAYVKLDAIIKETGLTLNWIINSIFQYRTDTEGSYSLFKNGKYPFTDDAIKKCRLIAQIVFVIENVVNKSELRSMGSLVAAISSLIVNDVNASELIAKIKKYPFLFKAQGNQVQYKELLETIYNYRNREKVSFKYK